MKNFVTWIRNIDTTLKIFLVLFGAYFVAYQLK